MSFLSAEPQSRVVLESHSKHLLAQFDTQLGFVENRYLAFFQERRSIEITYTNSLRKLYSKARTVDGSFGSRAEPTTTRAAWDTVRDNLNREVNSHQAFADILDNDVIKPLTRLKESNEETRRRIEKGLNGTAAQYADQAESKISELQHAYLKKYHPQHGTHYTEVVPNKTFGGKISTLLRGRREDASCHEPAISEEVFDYDCRVAVSVLNQYRSSRVELLRDGYDCLEELVFTTTVKDILVEYMNACAKYDSLAKSTRAEVENALVGTDMSDLKATFRRDLSFSIPPLTLYRNYRPGAYSNLVFGVPLVDVTINEDLVPKVMRLCIEEVEKRGLNTHSIYYLPDSQSAWPAEVLQLRHRFENEKSFSFTFTDKINFVAMLLELFLIRLPEPLFTLSLRDYRQYRQNRAGYTEDGFSLLRLKIRELNRVQRATLGALLRHLLRVASHSDENATTVNSLATQFWYPVLHGCGVLQDVVNINMKVLVMEDLIQNAHTLFSERPSPSEPVPSLNVEDTTSTFTYNSLLSSPDLPQQAEVEAMGSNNRHGPALFGSILTFMQSPSSLPTEGHLTQPNRTTLLSPRQGFPLSRTPPAVETTTQGQVIPEGRGSKAAETLESGTPAEVLSVQPTSVDQWRLQVSQSRLPPHPEAQTSPRSPPESVLYSISDFPRSSATSLQTGMGGFSL